MLEGDPDQPIWTHCLWVLDVTVVRVTTSNPPSIKSVGSISNPFGDNKIEIRTNEDGMVIGLTMMPLVNKGDALLHIASQKNQIYDEKFLVNDNINLTLD